MAPATYPAWLPWNRTPVTRSLPSRTQIAPPAAFVLCPGTLVRLFTNSPPWRVTSAEGRTDRAPPRFGEAFSRNEQLTNVALEPSSALTAPPPVPVPAAPLLTKAQSRNTASACDRVTAPAWLGFVLKPFLKVILSKVTRLPRSRRELTKRSSVRAPPPSSTTAAPAAARTVKPLRRLLMAKPSPVGR